MCPLECQQLGVLHVLGHAAIACLNQMSEGLVATITPVKADELLNHGGDIAIFKQHGQEPPFSVAWIPEEQRVILGLHPHATHRGG